MKAIPTARVYVTMQTGCRFYSVQFNASGKRYCLFTQKTDKDEAEKEAQIISNRILSKLPEAFDRELIRFYAFSRHE